MKYWYVLQHRWPLKTLYFIKEGHMLHSIYMKSKIGKFLEIESAFSGCLGLGNGGEMDSDASRYRVSWGDENF